MQESNNGNEFAEVASATDMTQRNEHTAHPEDSSPQVISDHKTFVQILKNSDYGA